MGLERRRLGLGPGSVIEREYGYREPKTRGCGVGDGKFMLEHKVLVGSGPT